ncbi:hypothetical protein TNIN_433471 [Trichonephila inaurata madagascariensis]|uniref:Uncharacterized protein n=1 Tax=Trichonephila inaurata madagascariensis TaxID=2747483 RepID=A0A8X7C262_9ARAC|nr:hypothetical protein TNIN_433471 [Trichonephila inaurata madagascariensis]
MLYRNREMWHLFCNARRDTWRFGAKTKHWEWRNWIKHGSLMELSAVSAYIDAIFWVRRIRSDGSRYYFAAQVVGYRMVYRGQNHFTLVKR